MTSIHLRETKEGNFQHQKGWRIQRDDGVWGTARQESKSSIFNFSPANFYHPLTGSNGIDMKKSAGERLYMIIKNL